MLGTTTLAPPNPPTALPALPISTQAVQLAGLTSFPQALWDLANGADPDHPLPSPSNPIAPIAEQLVLNLTTYGKQLLAGQGAQIPAEVATHLTNVGKVLQGVPDLITGTLEDTIGETEASAGGGVFLGALAGGAVTSVLFGWIPGLDPAAVGQLGTFAGAVIGAVVFASLTALTAPGGWVLPALSLRNDIAVALAAPVTPASASQPAASQRAASQPVASQPAASSRTAATAPHPVAPPRLRPENHIATASAPAASAQAGIGHARHAGPKAGSQP
jgi:hypothetical protein